MGHESIRKMSVFLSANSNHLAKLINSAHETVIYAAPGLNNIVANALLNVAKKVHPENVTVALDPSEDVLRLGYGSIEGITLLRENGITIREARGIRIGMLSCDKEGLIFSPTPLLIEAEKTQDSKPNAVKATLNQITSLVAAIAPTKATDISDGSEQEIGKSEVNKEEIEELEYKIKKDPPQSFDLARTVRVFSIAIEFVEIKLNGFDIHRRSVQLPANLMVGEIDKETKQRLSTAYKIIGRDSDISGKEISNEVKNLKQSYLKKIPKYGYVLLKANKQNFCNDVKSIEKKIRDFQKEIEKIINKEIKESREQLIKSIWPGVQQNPPRELCSQIETERPTKEQTIAYLTDKLKKIFPCAEKIIGKMSLGCVFKGVSHETISDEEFQKSIRDNFPYVDWDSKTKMLEEYDAVRAR